MTEKKLKETISNLTRIINEFSKNAVPVVRCKDCAYGTKVKNGCGEDAVECSLDMEHLCHSPDWYCADGERSET